MGSKKRLGDLDNVKIILILSLILILSEYLLNVFMGIYGINLGWFLVYIGVVYYFSLSGRPFLKSKDYLKKSKRYIWFALILFLGMSLFGYFFPVFFQEQILSMIEELIAKTDGIGGFELIRFIFLNNLKSSFFGLFFGLFFGIISFFILIVNGYVLGFVANMVVNEEGFFVLWRLFPHGIFEIPAVIISIGLGLRLGILLLFYNGSGKWGELKKHITDSFRVFVFIVIPLLIVAAIIEGSLIYLLG